MTQGTVQRDKIYVYGLCSQCGATDVLVYERDGKLLCAEDTRRWIAANPAQPQCDRCGEKRNVLRDPSHRRNEYLCLDCHADDGFVSRDSVTGAALLSQCLPPQTKKRQKLHRLLAPKEKKGH